MHPKIVNNFHIEIFEPLDKEIIETCCSDVSQNQQFHKVHSSINTHVYRYAHNDIDYYYKVFLQRKWSENLKEKLRGSRAHRSLNGHQVLLEHGFSAPKVLLLGKKKDYNFILMESYDHAIELEKCLLEIYTWDEEKRQRFLQELGTTIGKLHASGIFHGDLRWRNILIDFANDQTDIAFIDNERTTLYKNLPKRKRIKNLVQLYLIAPGKVEVKEQKIFWEYYLNENPQIAQNKAYWEKRITSKTNKRLDKKRKKRQKKNK
ncbi:lipopolysaccharide kinase InaA family protein [Candidatus Uabimicrobium amorphum]|uniref:3-deoxy-D-manno-octulosonic acid kinase n=1 Tax=Uabimicrobium amorphum TaxID=2596890 RepID=A0A5S9F2L5_UABAM|nr:lipopolysaccharide kinase InaA family protein [Candidatus Uabimicrobium amorphum]BBM83795.1 3-deoxy-D-manno-octulosonic acid kinase [Candidatus Uabimicrobium amorphum]